MTDTNINLTSDHIKLTNPTEPYRNMSQPITHQQIAPSGCWGHCIKQSYRAQGLIVRGIGRRQAAANRTNKNKTAPSGCWADRMKRSYRAQGLILKLVSGE